MPELPEVETLRQHLDGVARGFRVKKILVNKPRIVRPESVTAFKRLLGGQTIHHIDRRGKFLMVHLNVGSPFKPLIIHLGMSGRLFFRNRSDAFQDIPHLAVALEGDDRVLCYVDVRGFGRWTFDVSSLERMGPEPLDPDTFHPEYLQQICRDRSVKIKDLLMHQERVAGLGNIYVNEVLFLSRLHPMRPAWTIPKPGLVVLCQAIRKTLTEAVRLGTSSDLDFEGTGRGDGFFYFGRSGQADREVKERFRVSGREGQPCPACDTPILRMMISQRGTYFCPTCQTL
jgi:formamidopyrimidine-DNA glycosylase